MSLPYLSKKLLISWLESSTFPLKIVAHLRLMIWLSSVGLQVKVPAGCPFGPSMSRLTAVIGLALLGFKAFLIDAGPVRWSVILRRRT